MAAVTTDYNTATYVIDNYVIQREAGDWVVEQNLDGNDRRYLVLYNSADTGISDAEAINLPDALKLAWALVRQVVSVAARHTFHRTGTKRREGGAR